MLGLLLISLARLKWARNSDPVSYDELLDAFRSVRALKIQTSVKADLLWKMGVFGGDAVKWAKKKQIEGFTPRLIFHPPQFFHPKFFLSPFSPLFQSKSFCRIAIL